MEEDYISISEIANLLGISRQAVQKQLLGKINAGEVKVKTEGNKYLIEINTLPQELKDRLSSAQKQAIQKAHELARKPQKDIHFEKDLWAAADRLRGNIDSSEYKNVVLGLIFLKYISDSFYQQREKLQRWMNDPKNSQYYIPNKGTQEKILEDKDMYKKEGIFYIPETARWDFLRSKALFPDLAKYIDEAMEAIELENPEQLTGVLPKNYVRTQLESHILGELVNIFSELILVGMKSWSKTD